MKKKLLIAGDQKTDITRFRLTLFFNSDSDGGLNNPLRVIEREKYRILGKIIFSTDEAAKLKNIFSTLKNRKKEIMLRNKNKTACGCDKIIFSYDTKRKKWPDQPLRIITRKGRQNVGRLCLEAKHIAKIKNFLNSVC